MCKWNNSQSRPVQTYLDVWVSESARTIWVTAVIADLEVVGSSHVKADGTFAQVHTFGSRVAKHTISLESVRSSRCVFLLAGVLDRSSPTLDVTKAVVLSGVLGVGIVAATLTVDGSKGLDIADGMVGFKVGAVGTACGLGGGSAFGELRTSVVVTEQVLLAKVVGTRRSVTGRNLGTIAEESGTAAGSRGKIHALGNHVVHITSGGSLATTLLQHTFELMRGIEVSHASLGHGRSGSTENHDTDKLHG
jgi:hypothetical protein